jgi:nitrogen-specific signal transduction histidine kinase
MEVIVSGAQRAADLIEQMLAYAGEGRGVSKSVDLEALTRETVQLVEGSIGRGIPIQYEARPGVPPVYGDPIQIGQAVLNLLINAVEAVQDDGKGGPITGVSTRASSRTHSIRSSPPNRPATVSAWRRCRESFAATVGR